MNKRYLSILTILILILLLAAALRWAALPSMSDMLGFDESYYAADAASLLTSPRLTPFFPGNNGRESGWMYVLAAFMAGAGVTPFAARLAATFVGVLSVAASYRLGRELFSVEVGIGAAAGMAALYWPVHLSHIAMRATLLPLLGALSLAFMLAAHRTNRMRCWVVAGLFIGAMAYSYISAQAWIALMLTILLAWAFMDERRRRGALVAMTASIALAVPLIVYALEHPDQVLMRAGQSATVSEGAFVGALEAWLGAWFEHGDILLNHNIPGRPILDWATGALFVIGVIGLFATNEPWKPPAAGWRIALVFGLALISILPSLLSEFPPHFLRSIGLTVPVALVLGIGAATFARWISSLTSRMGIAPATSRALAMLSPVVLFLTAVVITHRDFHQTWLNLPEITNQFEQPTHQAVAAIEQLDPAVTNHAPIYFAPYELTHPAMQFSHHRLSPRRLGAFDSRACLIVSTTPAVYAILPTEELDLREALREWGSEVSLPSLPSAELMKLTPREDALVRADDWVARFGDAIEVRAAPSVSTTMRPGDQLSWQLRLRALRPLDRPYSLFVHLYKTEPSDAIDDGRKWAQGDQQMCASYPTTLWQPDEFAIQTYNLGLPADLTEGRYVVAIGAYDSETGGRLSASDGQGYAVLQRFEVSDK